VKVALVACVLVVATPLAALTLPGRLSRDVVPTRYAITLAPDLAHGTFDGRETIDVELARPTTRITLDAFALAIVDARVNAGDETQEATIAIDEARQTLTLILKRPIPTGPARIILGWNAPLEDDLVGFYQAEAHGRRYALTHFEPANARRAFPCFDEPDFKARVALTAVVDATDDAISNTPIAQVTMLPGTKKLGQFAATPPLPTYLVTLAVGRFAALTRDVDGVRLRLLAPPEDVARGDFALDAAAQLLPRFVSYFGARYPFAKLDLIAVPALFPGGMENAGAIFLRGERVLVDRAPASPSQLRAVERLVAHELAHQWLGDLVTPRWWDDLWLNEATATFAANEVLAAAHPERRPWLDFQQPLEDVLADDELRQPRAVRTPIADGRRARDAFDGMTYVKGAAILHMLDGWLGPGAIRRALAAYLDVHRYASADATDFAAALDTTTSRPVSDVLRAWLERDGHPRLDVSGHCHDGALHVTLSQSRAGGTSARDPVPWPIPIVLHWPSGTRTMLFDTRTAGIAIAGCPAWIEANADRAGFYRVRYASSLASALSSVARRQLDPVERVGLVSDAWADVRAGAASVSQFLALVTSLRGERSPAVMAALDQRLTFIAEELLPAEAHDAFARYVAAELAPQYHALGLQSGAGEDDETRMLRAEVLDLLGRVARPPELIAAADETARQYLANRTGLDPSLAGVMLQLAARHGNDARFHQLVSRLKDTHNLDQQRQYLDALAGFDRPDLLRRTLALLLTPLVPQQDLIALIATLMTQGRTASATAWRFLRNHYDAIAERSPRLGWLLTPAAQLCDERSARQVNRFFAELPHRPSTPRRLQQTAESIAECVALRRRTAAPLAAWLHAHKAAP
jgi:puromycin-sensitive aminopeptidase